MNAMTARPEKHTAPASWHLHLVGTLALVWGVLCVARYLAFQTGDLSPQTVDAWQLTPFYDLPSIIMATWAISTWGAVAGACLLLVRSKLAVPAFTMALIGLIGTSAYQFLGVENPISIYDTPFNFAVWLVALAALLYASRVDAQELLR